MNNMPKYHGSARGAAKRGPALLAGLLRCARCGRKLHVCYSGTKGKVVRYGCRGGNVNHGVSPCLSFGGLRVDEAVVQMVLSALQPLGIDAALQAWENSRQDQDLKLKSLQLALEKARYEADRVRRQYDAVDPANRLVASELESRWNLALAGVEAAQKQVEVAYSAELPLGEPERKRLLQLGSDLESIWKHPATPATLKKRVLRTVIEEIVADVDKAGSEMSFKIHWAGGRHTSLRLPKNHTGGHRRTASRDVVDLVRELVQVSSDGAIASILNRLGYRTGAGNTWTETHVLTLRRHRGIPGHQRIGSRSWLTLANAANELNVSAGTVRKMLERKILPGKQVVANAPWVINREDLQLPAVQNYVGRLKAGKRVPRHDNNQETLPL